MSDKAISQHKQMAMGKGTYAKGGAVKDCPPGMKAGGKVGGKGAPPFGKKK